MLQDQTHRSSQDLFLEFLDNVPMGRVAAHITDHDELEAAKKGMTYLWAELVDLAEDKHAQAQQILRSLDARMLAHRIIKFIMDGLTGCIVKIQGRTNKLDNYMTSEFPRVCSAQDSVYRHMSNNDKAYIRAVVMEFLVTLMSRLWMTEGDAEPRLTEDSPYYHMVGMQVELWHAAREVYESFCQSKLFDIIIPYTQ